MAHRDTSSITSRSQTTTTSTPSTPARNMSIGRDIHRIAIEQSATLGSFYDARTESLVGKLSLNKNVIIKKSRQRDIDCMIMNGDSFNIEEVFHHLRIEDELILDLMLDSASLEPLAELCNYPFPTGRNTRYLIYYYLSEEQSISPNKDVVKLNIPKVIPDSTVTHVISTVKLGIQVVIVLQLPSSDDTNLDRLLDETKRQLLNSKFQVSNSERVPLDQITVTKVFSNVPDLCKMSKLSDICQRITELKPNACHHCQVEYTLRSIHWFDPTYPKEKDKYIPLDLEEIRMITQHLLSLSSQINKLKMSLNTEDKQRLRKPLKKQYDTIEEQFLQVEEIYQSEIKRIRDLVMKIRCETMQPESISEELLDISRQSLQNSIQHIETYLRSLKENEELSNRIDQDNITSMNIDQHSKDQAVDLNTSFEKLHPNHRSGFKSGDQLEEPKTRLSSTSSTAQSLEQGPSTSLKTSTSLTSSTIAKLGAEHAPERKTVNVNNKEKLVSSRKLSTPQEPVESEDQAKGNDESVLVLMTQQTTTARDLTNQDIEAEDVEKTSNQPAPKPSPRKNKPMARKNSYILSGTETKSTTENIVLLTEQINHIGQENERSKSSIASLPPVRSQTKPRDGNLKEPATNLINSSTSDTIQSAVKGSGSTKVRPKSSSASASSKKVSQELNRPMSASTSLKPANTRNTSFRKTLRRSINEQNKSSMHSTESLSHICLTLHSPDVVNDDALNLSKSLQETNFESTLNQSEQPVFEKDSAIQLESSNSLTPKIRYRERRSSEKDELEILNETRKLQQSPKILTPQGVSISTQKPTNSKEHLNHQSCLPSSTTEGPKYTGEYSTIWSSVPRSVLDNSQPPKEQAEDKKKQTTSSSLLPSFNKRPGTRQKHVSPPISTNPIHTMETSTNEMQSVEVNEKAKSQLLRTQSFSDIRSKANTKNDDNKKLLNSSASSKSSKIHNKSLQPSRSVSSDNLSVAPRQPTRPATAPSPARLRRQHSKNETVLTQADSFKSSTTEVPTFLKKKIKNEAAQINHLDSTKRSAHQDLPKTNQEVISHKELANQQTLSEPKHVNKMSSSEGKVMCTVGPVLPLEFRSDVSSETVQPNNNASQVARIRTEQLDSETSSTEHAPILEQKSRDIITPNHIQLLDTQSTQETTQEQTSHSNLPRPSLARASSSTVKYINILLLGASGVGKSTFINALVNYLAFQTFQDAQANQPLAVIPVSFLITEGDDFREKIVKFGGDDPNEDHDHPGQSVTQHCRGYIISLNDQTKLRIIDTPGMGDTRGLEQDDRNIEHILSFISHLSHLDAICILLKPNESRLDIVLRPRLTRLLNFLGENARNNIVFCFTNTRSTFYAPGDTAPLLKQMLRQIPVQNVPFKKENTFCFDSESFRYLVALQNGVTSDAYQETKYQRSWVTSSTVSVRFLEYIFQELKPYHQNEWQSIEHVLFKVNQLTRPMLETIRNILRNIALLKDKSSQLIIKLRPIVLSESSCICYGCSRTPKRFVDFWIFPDDLHTFFQKCDKCQCSRAKHIDVNYKLEYEVTDYESNQQLDQMRYDLNKLRMTIIGLAQFYGYVVNNLKQNDPLLSALNRIIAEENAICSQKGHQCLNTTLRKEFVIIKEEYEKRRPMSSSIHGSINLSFVFEQIKAISEINEISVQLRAINQGQAIYLRQNEMQVI